MLFKTTVFTIAATRAGYPPDALLRAAADRAAVRTGLQHARRLLDHLWALVIDPEARSRRTQVIEAALDGARRDADQWRDKAEVAERRVAELEVALRDQQMLALDLRSRVVCLHGKLATTAATVRYQSLALALEQGEVPAGPDDEQGPAA